jgi:hypothetical protein
MNTYSPAYIFQALKVFKMNTPFFFQRLQGRVTVQCKGKSLFFARFKVIFARVEVIFARFKVIFARLTARWLIFSRMIFYFINKNKYLSAVKKVGTINAIDKR